MKNLLTIFCILLVATFAACDLRSGIAKQEMEKFNPSPTPSMSPTPTPEPIDPADVVQIDTTQEGPPISIDGFELKRSVNCTKYNRVMINGDESNITIKGVCRQVMINGDKNKITADAAMEYVVNGTENTVNYSKFANGKRPSVIENKPGNTIEKALATNKK